MAIRPQSAVALALLAVLAGAHGAAAQTDEPLVTDRPDFTESTPTIAPGHLQLEGGLTGLRVAGEETIEAGELLLRIGVIDGLELRIEPGTWVDGPDDSGLGDATIGFKVRLHEPAESGAMPALSFLFTTALTTGEEGFGGDELQPEAKLLLAWDLPRGLSLGSNLGIAKVHEGGERFDQGVASVTVGMPLADRLGAFFELYGIFPPERHADDAIFTDAGITFLVNDDVQLDFRVGRQLSGDERETTVGLGAAVRW